MALTRDEFVTEICDVVGKRTAASSVSGAALSTRVITYLNFAQKRMARHHSFYELRTTDVTSADTVADVKIYPMTTGTNNLGLTRVKDIDSIRLIDSENSFKLTRWSSRKFDKWYPRPENYTTGRPRLYIRDGNNLELFRIPDDAYDLTIRYSQWAQDFTTGTQESDFLDKDQLLVSAGILETYLALEEYADAAVWFNRFKGQLKDAVDAEGDVDWEPEAEPGLPGPPQGPGQPWLDPYGNISDPLYGY